MTISMYTALPTNGTKWDFANYDGSGNKRTDYKKNNEWAQQQLGLQGNLKPYHN